MWPFSTIKLLRSQLKDRQSRVLELVQANGIHHQKLWQNEVEIESLKTQLDAARERIDQQPDVIELKEKYRLCCDDLKRAMAFASTLEKEADRERRHQHTFQKLLTFIERLEGRIHHLESDPGKPNK